MTQESLPLPLAVPETTASTVSAALTKSLADRLLGAGSPELAAEDVSKDSALLDEARAAHKAVARLAGPCGKDYVYVALQPALILYGPPDFGMGDAGDTITRTWLDLYKNALFQLPKEALDEAVSEYIARGDGHPSSRVKFPKPAQLVALAEPTASRLRKLAWRLRVAVETAHKYVAPPKRSAEDVAAIQRMKDEAVARLRSMPKGGSGSRRESQSELADRIRASGL